MNANQAAAYNIANPFANPTPAQPRPPATSNGASYAGLPGSSSNQQYAPASGLPNAYAQQQQQQQQQQQPQAQAGPGPSSVINQAAQNKEKEKEEEAKKELERKRKDKNLGEFMVMLDDYKPLIPDEVTDYYLQKSGFECEDPRLRNLLSLAAQKFISDIATDAFHYSKLRNNITGISTSSGAAATGGDGAGKGKGKDKKDQAKKDDKNRVVLTMDDLSLALGDHGIKNKRPDYYF